MTTSDASVPVGESLDAMLLPCGAERLGVSGPDAGGVVLLQSLPPGRQARVLEILPDCRGPERRRLLDLGFLPGSLIRVMSRAPFGSPTVYRVRGTHVALRPSQAGVIRVRAAE